MIFCEKTRVDEENVGNFTVNGRMRVVNGPAKYWNTEKTKEILSNFRLQSKISALTV